MGTSRTVYARYELRTDELLLHHLPGTAPGPRQKQKRARIWIQELLSMLAGIVRPSGGSCLLLI